MSRYDITAEEIFETQNMINEPVARMGNVAMWFVVVDVASSVVDFDLYLRLHEIRLEQVHKSTRCERANHFKNILQST